MSSLRLYSYYRSSCAYRVRIGLYLKELDFEYVPVHLLKSGGEQFQDSFKQLNPFSQVPCLEHGSKTLSQSLPILLYLEDLKSLPRLLPKDSFRKAEILSFCEMINSGIQPLHNLSVLKYVESKNLSDKKPWAKYWIEKGLSRCEEFLKSRARAFCFGEEVTLADLFLIPQLASAKRFEADTSAFPLLEKINSHCLKQPAFQKAMPKNQPDAPQQANQV